MLYSHLPPPPPKKTQKKTAHYLLPFYRTLRENNEKSSRACCVREIDLQKLPKGAALSLCHQSVTPLAWCESSSIVKIVHREIFDESNADQTGQHLQGVRARIITDFFYESIQSLVSVGEHYSSVVFTPRLGKFFK